LNIISLKTTLGFSMASNVGFFSEATPLQKWRTWVETQPITKTKGAMAWTTWDMEALNAAAPSGKIAFPEFIDANKPVILRDLDFDNWLGVFMPNRLDKNDRAYTVEPATLPSWWK
jgi:hypothetical protein